MKLLLVAVLLGISGCAFFSGLFSADKPTRHTCVVTSKCSADKAETSNADACLARKDQKAHEAKLADAALGALRAMGCKDPKTWAACYDDLTSCTP
jgi:hypothetical protein